jgi:uncharacterized protein
MSTMDAAYNLPRTGTLPTRAPQAERAPWGFWGSLGWGAFAAVTGLFAVFVYTIIWMLTHGLRVVDPKDPIFATATGILLLTAPIVALAIAVKIRQLPLCGYFALAGFSRHSLVIGLIGLVALTVGFGTIAALFGIEDGSKYMEASYRAAKAAGILPLLWLSVVVVAPVTEELFFRGFLHRGWARSWLGITGTIVVTSALWAMLHQQYNALGILVIFVMGLLLGWLRQRSGSTLLPMALHAVNNLLATVAVTIKVEWLS